MTKHQEPWFYYYDYNALPDEVLNGEISEREAEAIQRYHEALYKSSLHRSIESAMQTRIENRIVQVLNENPRATVKEIEDEVQEMVSYLENFRIMTYHVHMSLDTYYHDNPPDGVRPFDKEFLLKQAIYVHRTGT